MKLLHFDIYPGCILWHCNVKRSLFCVSCSPFPFDNPSSSIISHLIYCLWGEELIPTGCSAYCSPFLRVSKWFFLNFIMTDWKGSTLEQVARHVMVVIAVYTLIDVRKLSGHPKRSGSESKGMGFETGNRDVCWLGAWTNLELFLQLCCMSVELQFHCYSTNIHVSVRNV